MRVKGKSISRSLQMREDLVMVRKSVLTRGRTIMLKRRFWRATNWTGASTGKVRYPCRAASIQY
jgi:hypothetical protein